MQLNTIYYIYMRRSGYLRTSRCVNS